MFPCVCRFIGFSGYFADPPARTGQEPEHPARLDESRYPAGAGVHPAVRAQLLSEPLGAHVVQQLGVPFVDQV
jgi:hypothetical protein